MTAWLWIVSASCLIYALMIPRWTGDHLREMSQRHGRYRSLRLARLALVAQGVLTVAIAITASVLAAATALGSSLGDLAQRLVMR